MEFTVFTIDDKIAGAARRHGTMSSEDLDGLAMYVLKHFAAEPNSAADAVIFADPDGNLTFIDPNASELPRVDRYAMAEDHRYTVVHNAGVGTWDTRRRPLEGHDQVLSTFHSIENAVAYAEKDARGGSEGRVT